MLAKIQKRGNSQGLRITKALLADAQINIGADVNVAAKDGALIVTPAQRNRSKNHLNDLVARIPKGYQVKETDWGKSVGNEVWQMLACIPKRGDMIAITFEPQADHEQKGCRPVKKRQKTERKNF